MDSLSHKAQQIKDDLLDLITNIDWTLQDKEQYEYYKRMLELTESRITKYEQLNIAITDELRNQKLKYKMKVLDFEDTIKTVKVLSQIKANLNAQSKANQLSDKYSSNGYLYEFNGGKIPEKISPTKASRHLKAEIHNISIAKLARIINKVCDFKEEIKISVKEGELCYPQDPDFHNNIFRIIHGGPLKKILEEELSDKSIDKFYPSELLGHYVNHYLKNYKE